MELMAVIAMIGVLAAASAPSLIHFLRDRRVADAGTEVANLIRFARARAMGRGTAVNVRFTGAPGALNALNEADPNARLVIKEAVMGAAAVDADQATLGNPNCLGTNWGVGSLNARYITMFDERRNRYSPSVATFVDENNNTLANADICFTPRGRVWRNYNGGGFLALTGVPYIQVQNPDTGMLRRIIIPPSGAARLITEL